MVTLVLSGLVASGVARSRVVGPGQMLGLLFGWYDTLNRRATQAV